MLLPFLPDTPQAIVKFQRIYNKYGKYNPNSFLDLNPHSIFSDPLRFYNEYKMICYEGRLCKVFINYKEFLISKYGKDYMVPQNYHRIDKYTYYLS